MNLGGEKWSAVIIGAGFSGIDAAIKLKNLGIPFVIIEKSEKLGGTWWDNQYPGAACDVPSHLYRYAKTFEKVKLVVLNFEEKMWEKEWSQKCHVIVVVLTLREKIGKTKGVKNHVKWVVLTLRKKSGKSKGVKF